MKPTPREAVQQVIRDLTSAAWFSRDEPGELERLHEVQELAREQLADDSFKIASQEGRMGRRYVGRLHEDDDGLYVYVKRGGQAIRYREDSFRVNSEARSDDQLALELAFRPVLDRLAPDDRSLVYWRFNRFESLGGLARMLHRAKSSIQRREEIVLRTLREIVCELYPLEEVAP